jgi:hypothetical protein
MRSAWILVVPLLAFGACAKPSASILGTYIQEAHGQTNSALQTSIILQEGGRFEMSGMLRLAGSYTLTGNDLALTPDSSTPSAGVAPTALHTTLKDGVIEMSTGIVSPAPLRFKKQ